MNGTYDENCGIVEITVAFQFRSVLKHTTLCQLH